MSKLREIFSVDYLFSPTSGTKYEDYYLIFPLLIIILTFGYRLFIFFKKNRPEAYRFFDKLWFWGGITFGSSGLFIYFARTQGLPIFSTRAVSYLWIFALFAYMAFLVYYFFRRLPVELNRYYEKKRKAKYLRK